MYDFAIIGGGIIGLSTGYGFGAMLSNARIVVLEGRLGTSNGQQ